MNTGVEPVESWTCQWQNESQRARVHLLPSGKGAECRRGRRRSTAGGSPSAPRSGRGCGHRTVSSMLGGRSLPPPAPREWARYAPTGLDLERALEEPCVHDGRL